MFWFLIEVDNFSSSVFMIFLCPQAGMLERVQPSDHSRTNILTKRGVFIIVLLFTWIHAHRTWAVKICWD